MPTLPLDFTTEFGDYTPPPALRALDGTPLAWRDAVGDEAVGLLISQFRKARIETMLRALAAGAQDLEDGVWSFLVGIWLDTAEGVWLDVLGEIVAFPRLGWDDDAYRLYLKGRIRSLGTDGSWPWLISILDVLGIDLPSTEIYESGPLAGRVVLGAELAGDLDPTPVFDLLVAAKGASVRLRLEYLTSDLDHSFAAADGDVFVNDDARGAADDGETIGGYVAGSFSTTEAA